MQMAGEMPRQVVWRGRTITHRPLGGGRELLGGEWSRTRTRKPYGKLYPNGELSVAYKYETDSEGETPSESFSFLRGSAALRRGSGGTPPDVSLVSTQQSSQRDEKGGRKLRKYGLKGISRYGARRVRSGAYVIQKAYPRHKLCFLTATVPTLSRQARAKLAQGWGQVTRQVGQLLKRRLKAARQPELYVGVTELQSRRCQRYGEAYLHLHIVFPSRSRDNKRWVLEVDEFRSWWIRLISRVSGEDVGGYARVETKDVESSVEGYLGKYMSKGHESMQGIVDDLGEESVPGQQWTMSKPLKKAVDQNTREGFRLGAWLQTLVEEVVKGVKLPGYWKLIKVDYGGREISVGWVGKVHESRREELALPPLDVSAIIALKSNFQ